MWPNKIINVLCLGVRTREHHYIGLGRVRRLIGAGQPRKPLYLEVLRQNQCLFPSTVVVNTYVRKSMLTENKITPAIIKSSTPMSSSARASFYRPNPLFPPQPIEHCGNREPGKSYRHDDCDGDAELFAVVAESEGVVAGGGRHHTLPSLLLR